MTTTTVFASSDGYITSSNSSLATMLAGGGSLSVDTTLDSNLSGLGFSSPTYYGRLSYLSFDTSSIADGDAVSAVDLILKGKDDALPSGFSIIAKSFDWSSSGLTTADWRTDSQLSALTTLATLTSASFSNSAYNTFTSAGSAFNSWVNKTGSSYLLLVTDEHIAGTPTPTDFTHQVAFSSVDTTGTTSDPKLTITHAGGVYTITAGSGSYAFTGTAATPKYGRKASAAAGSYAFTGTDAALKHAWRVTAAGGSYVFTGTAATLTKASGASIGAGAGSYAFTGTNATLKHAWNVAAGAGSYAFTGTAASPLYGWKIPAGAGSYVFTGTAVSFRMTGWTARTIESELWTPRTIEPESWTEH